MMDDVKGRLMGVNFIFTSFIRPLVENIPFLPCKDKNSATVYDTSRLKLELLHQLGIQQH